MAGTFPMPSGCRSNIWNSQVPEPDCLPVVTESVSTRIWFHPWLSWIGTSSRDWVGIRICWPLIHNLAGLFALNSRAAVWDLPELTQVTAKALPCSSVERLLRISQRFLDGHGHIAVWIIMTELMVTSQPWHSFLIDGRVKDFFSKPIEKDQEDVSHP